MKRPVSLKPRLLAIAGQIPPGARVADIGTDHARLPLYLISKGIAAYVIATDLRPGPLEMAARKVGIHGGCDRIELRLGDGGAALSPEEIDCAVIAGMGGDSIIAILDAGSWLLDKKLLLQPQTRAERLAEYLRAAGKGFSEIRAEEGRRSYTIFATEGKGGSAGDCT